MVVVLNQIFIIPMHIFFNLFIYFWLCWVFSFLCGGFLQLRRAGATLHRGAWACHCRGLCCCGAQAPDAQAQQLWLTGPAALRHVGSSQTWARTRVPCIGRRILNHCATREAPHAHFYIVITTEHILNSIVQLICKLQAKGLSWCIYHTTIFFTFFFFFLSFCILCFKYLVMQISVVLVHSLPPLYSMKFGKYTTFIYYPADRHLGHSQQFSVSNEALINLFVMSPCEYL